MSKKKDEKLPAPQPEAHIHEQEITDTLEINYMPYAMSVIVSRAIPEIDGFKPAHRKLLYTMYKMGLLNGPRTKSANIVGQTMKLNPHGDQTIYETMVRLTRGNAALLHPYIDSKGNFGKQYSRDMAYAAPRYTEARLDKICEALFGEIDKDVVDMVDNYDGQMKEPTLLPATFPSVLVNANQGIAVGMASNICSFNLHEVCEATKAYIKDPACEIMDYMPAPDFSGGGELVYDLDDMAKIYKSGRGSFKLRSRYRIDKAKNLIEIFEIPYSTSVEAIIDGISALVKSNKVKDIIDVRDETDLNGLKLTIDYRKSTDPEQLMQRLFAQKCGLEESFSCNFNMLINGTPRVLGVKQIIAEWLSFRRQCVRRGLAYDLQKKQERLHLLKGLEKILLDIDKAIEIIRKTEKESDVIPNLMQGFDIDALQAEYVAEIKLRHLNRQYILQRTADIKKLKSEIKNIQELLADNERIDALISEQLSEIDKKFGQERRTQLVLKDEIEIISKDDMIEDYNLKLFLTAHGYIKKLALTSLRSAGELKTKEDDEIVQDLDASNKQELILFSNRSNAYKLFVYEIPDQKPSDLGSYGQNLLDLTDGEYIVFMYLPQDYSGSLIAAFENGKVARFTADSFATKTRRKKLLNAYSAKSPLVALHAYDPERPDYFLLNDAHKLILFDVNLLSLMSSRNTQGVQVLTMKKGQKILRFKALGQVAVEEPEYYRIRKLPARGFYLKEDDLAARQQSLLSDDTE